MDSRGKSTGEIVILEMDIPDDEPGFLDEKGAWVGQKED
jgi:hypothetical protein